MDEEGKRLGADSKKPSDDQNDENSKINHKKKNLKRLNIEEDDSHHSAPSNQPISTQSKLISKPKELPINKDKDKTKESTV